MANIDDHEVRIQALENKILAATLLPKFTKDPTDSSVAVNDLVLGKKTGINGGFMFIGKVNTTPPTQDSHIDDLVPF